ncbi:hypothetical protein F9B85_10360 [Heliorestis acidaminivorans]|uniref:Contractile injection system tube protein N-terminal domain-containing protein n=1 Tax=Heliorestis acidaminivorans TaxID=553427 RepID=A0A6I0EYS8_9FIRM|nr:hypothetical protein [Heliorestis acidaminivorans]KAB2951952.1 hypothetical protein F9B85_10360 [Heliorestis acidaminivorans]
MLNHGGPDKAKIKILTLSEYSNTVSQISMSQGEILTVQINPNKLTITDGVSYGESVDLFKRKPRTLPTEQYLSHQARELKVELLFDTYTSPKTEDEKEDVKKVYINKFTKLLTNNDARKPPRVFFSWGSIQFMGLVTNLTYTYTMFTRSGKPVRATMDLTLKEFDFQVGTR